MNRILFSASLFIFVCVAHAQNFWTQKTDFPGGDRTAACVFSIGNYSYVGCGYDSADYKRNFYRYDCVLDQWTQINSLGGSSGSGLGRDVAAAFAINGKGYVGTGQGSNPYYQDFWEYNPATDNWTQKANFGGTGRRSTVSFAIGSKGYIGLGQDIVGFKNDLWEYDPSTNVWTQKANFIGTARRLAVGFPIGSIAYVGLGDDGVFRNDFYKYDPSANTWTSLGTAAFSARYSAIGFGMNGKGYVGLGYDNTLVNKNDFYEYDPGTNGWTTMAPFPGTPRSNATAFSGDWKGFVCLGYDGNPTNTKDLYMYTGVVGLNEQEVSVTASFYPNPMTASAVLSIQSVNFTFSESTRFEMFDVNGHLVKDMAVLNVKTEITRDNLASGTYFYSVSSKEKIYATGKILVQ